MNIPRSSVFSLTPQPFTEQPRPSFLDDIGLLTRPRPEAAPGGRANEPLASPSQTDPAPPDRNALVIHPDSTIALARRAR